MICKANQRLIDFLLRLKDTNKPTEQKTINLIGSYEDSIPGIFVHHQSKPIIGELAEFQSLLKLKVM